MPFRLQVEHISSQFLLEGIGLVAAFSYGAATLRLTGQQLQSLLPLARPSSCQMCVYTLHFPVILTSGDSVPGHGNLP